MTIKDSIAIHHRGFKELEGYERDGNWDGHVAWKYTSGGGDGLPD